MPWYISTPTATEAGVQWEAGDRAGRCGGDRLRQHHGLYSWPGTGAPGAGAGAPSAGRGMPRQAAQKPLPRSVPLPLMASGFAALSDSVKGVVPCVRPVLPAVPPALCPFPACLDACSQCGWSSQTHV